MPVLFRIDNAVTDTRSAHGAAMGSARRLRRRRTTDLRQVLARVALAVLATGCAGTGSHPGVITRVGESSSAWKPRAIGLLFPQLAPDSMPDRDVSLGPRPFNGSEISAVVHAAVKTHLAARARPEVRDLAEAGPSRERLGLLTTVLLREYWLNGTLPPRPVAELGRVSGCDAVLIVSVIKFGPSAVRLSVKNLSGDIRKGQAEGGVNRWLNCGIKVALVKIATAAPVWEAAYLESRPDQGNSQEMVAAGCVESLLADFPYRP